jgi:CheY-like chemotaxis protein
MITETVQPATQTAAMLAANRILIVDDHSDARMTLSVVLERMGQQVVEAENGAAALDAARKFHPEIVLCDIGLPDMDGYAVAKAIRADPLLKDIRLIAVTGYGQVEDQSCAFKAGFDRHLPKPFSHDQLRELLLTIHRPGDRVAKTLNATSTAPY